MESSASVERRESRQMSMAFDDQNQNNPPLNIKVVGMASKDRIDEEAEVAPDISMLNIIVIGDKQVGKTSLLQALGDTQINKRLMSSQDLAFTEYIKLNYQTPVGTSIRVRLWDTTGQ